VDRDQSDRRLRGLQISRRLLAPVGHDVVANLLAFHQGAHAGALHRTDMHEHVLAAVARLDESKAFFTVPVAIMASLHFNAFVYPITRASRGRSSNFGGSWLGTVKRERREADRKLVAGCYLCDRGRNVKPDAGINLAQAVALGNRRSRRGVEWHRY